MNYDAATFGLTWVHHWCIDDLDIKDFSDHHGMVALLYTGMQMYLWH